MTRQSTREHRSRILAINGLALASVLAAGLLAHGQGAQIIRMEDDGSGAIPQIIHFSLPDFAELRQPEFVQRDLPTFTDELVLSDAQTKVVETLIMQYLEDFKKLSIEHLPPDSSGPMRIRLGPGGGEAGDGGVEGEEGEFQAMFLGVDEELPDIAQMIEDDPELAEMEGEMPRKMAVGVQVRMGEPGPDGAPAGQAAPEGEAGVSISFEGPDGQEIPEEVRKKLEEAASKMAEKMKQQLEQQAAEGGDPHALPLREAMSIEQMQQRQEQMAAQVEQFRKDREALRQRFVTDAQANLIPDQIERWPELERTLLRNKSLPKGRLAGERIDLVKIAAGVEISEGDRTKIAGDVQAYEVTLDAALKRRDALLVNAHRDIDRAMQANDPDKALSIVDKVTDLRMAVRAVNQQFAQALAAELPEDVARAFREKVQKSSYPLIYRPTRGQKTFDVALKLEDLTSTTRANVAELQTAYLLDLADANSQIRQAVDKFEPLEPRIGIERSKRVMDGESPDVVFGVDDRDPIREAYSRRRDLDDRYCKLVADMLTPEQVAMLPKAPEKPSMQPIIITRPVGTN